MKWPPPPSAPARMTSSQSSSHWRAFHEYTRWKTGMEKRASSLPMKSSRPSCLICIAFTYHCGSTPKCFL